jgi:hypothetical protein
VVWNLLLQAGSEGPALISQAVTHIERFRPSALVAHTRPRIGGATPKLSIAFDDDRTEQIENTTTQQVTHDDKIVFPSVSAILAHLLREKQLQVLLLLDEWSSLPWDVQPYLAEFLRRGFFANNSVTIKIASLEQRSNFTQRMGTGFVGLEAGSDISAALEIDDYYVFEKDPDNVTNVFADILFRHLAAIDSESRVYAGGNPLVDASVRPKQCIQSSQWTKTLPYQELLQAIIKQVPI